MGNARWDRSDGGLYSRLSELVADGVENIDQVPIPLMDEMLEAGHSTESVGREIRRMRRPVNKLPIPERRIPTFDEPMQIVSSKTLVLSDLHGVHASPRFLNNLIDLSMSWGVGNVVVNGDLFDHAAFSSYPPEEREAAFNEEIACIEEIVSALEQRFRSTVISLGNHDERFLKRFLGSKLAIRYWKRLFSSSDKVSVINAASTVLKSGHGRYFICHPRNYSKIPTKVALDIQKESKTTFHVITAHTHNVGMSLRRTDTGVYWCIDSGMTAQAGSMAYAETPSTSPLMNMGAVIVMPEQPYLLTPQSPFKLMSRLYSDV